MEIFRTFPTLREAVEYRREHGTGGFIYEVCVTGQAILFPPGSKWSATASLAHPLTRGSGRLVE